MPTRPTTEGDRLIRLSVPGSLEFRDVAVRVVGTACRLLRPKTHEVPATLEGEPTRTDFAQDEFATQVVSAFSEAFNNLAIHGYKSASLEGPCRIDIEVTADATSLCVRLFDWGSPYDPAAYEELPDELPERGMGLFIIRSFMDEVGYTAGPPNVLTLKKKWSPFLASSS